MLAKEISTEVVEWLTTPKCQNHSNTTEPIVLSRNRELK